MRIDELQSPELASNAHLLGLGGHGLLTTLFLLSVSVP